MVTLKEDRCDLEEIQKPDLSILDYVPILCVLAAPNMQ